MKLVTLALAAVVLATSAGVAAAHPRHRHAVMHHRTHRHGMRHAAVHHHHHHRP